jgi:hypothetical protein
MLTVLESLPDGLLQLEAHELHRVLPGPTLVHLPGRREPPLFVSVLLHGNEVTGWLALRELLRGCAGRPLPRALSVLVGNVAAAREGVRRLEGQADHNRIWSGGDSPEHHMAREVLEQLRRRGLFAAVDVHNNTGLNPHYACVNVLDHRYLHLATLFSRTVVYFIRPASVASMALAALGPAVTLECGQPGQPHGTEHAVEYLRSCLNLLELPTHPVAEADLDLFHTVAVMTLPEDLTFGFSAGTPGLQLAGDLDRMNFRELPRGTVLGWTDGQGALPVEAWDESGRNVAPRYFELAEGELRTRVPLMPSMLTLDTRVIRQDCLGYVMERYRAPGPRDDAAA